MTPSKKKDLYYAMQTVQNLATFVGRIGAFVYDMSRDADAGLNKAGVTWIDECPVYQEMEDVRIAYDHFCDVVRAARGHIEEVYQKENEK